MTPYVISSSYIYTVALSPLQGISHLLPCASLMVPDSVIHMSTHVLSHLPSTKSKAPCNMEAVVARPNLKHHCFLWSNLGQSDLNIYHQLIIVFFSLFIYPYPCQEHLSEVHQKISTVLLVLSEKYTQSS